MARTEITDRLAEATGHPEAEIETLLDGFVEVLKNCNIEGDSVAIPGFGTFTPVKTEETVRTDVESGKRFLIPPAVNIRFKSSVLLRKKLIG